jgi:hypothetical protein
MKKKTYEKKIYDKKFCRKKIILNYILEITQGITNFEEYINFEYFIKIYASNNKVLELFSGNGKSEKVYENYFKEK